MTPIRQALEDAEIDLRECHGVERFKVGKTTLYGRTTGGELGIDFGEEGAREANHSVRAVFLKNEWPGQPREFQKVTWYSEAGEKTMQIENIRGFEATSPSWHLDLRSS